MQADHYHILDERLGLLGPFHMETVGHRPQTFEYGKQAEDADRVEQKRLLHSSQRGASGRN